MGHTTFVPNTVRCDESSKLQNNLNRWYDAAVGQWMSEDTIGFAAGDANLYQYVANNSTALIACMLIMLYTGKAPTKRTFEMLCFYLAGWTELDEVAGHIDKLNSKAP